MSSIRKKTQQQQRRMHCLLNVGLSSKLCCDTQSDVLCHYVSLMCVVLLSFLPFSSSPMSSSSSPFSPSLLSFSLCSFVLNQCGVKRRRVCVKGNGTLSSARRRWFHACERARVIVANHKIDAVIIKFIVIFLSIHHIFALLV